MFNNYRSFTNELVATFRCELKLFLRNTSTPILIGLLLGVCVLLLPGSDSNYTIISFASAKPLMTADTYLVTAGVVLATLLFPYYLLTMSLNQVRDRNLYVDDLFFNIENNKLPLFIGRVTANFLKIAALSILLCSFLVLILVLKLGHAPVPEAITIFLILVISSGFGAVGIAIMIEHLFINQRNWLLLVAFGLWVYSMVVYIFYGWDLHGFSVLEAALPEEYSDSAIAFGIIAGENLNTFEWSTIPEISTALNLAKNNLLISCASIFLAFFVVRLFSFSRKLKDTVITSISTKRTSKLEDASQKLSTFDTHFNFLSSLTTELRLILNQHFLFIGLALVVLALSILLPVHNGTQIAIPSSLAGLFVIFRSQYMSFGKTTSALESALAPLQFPNPQVLRTIALTILIALPLLPIMFNLNAGRVLVLISAIMLSSGWLILAFQKWRRPVLGLSTFALFWYATGLNTISPELDLMAIHSFSFTALLINSILLLGVSKALFYKSSNVKDSLPID